MDIVIDFKTLENQETTPKRDIREPKKFQAVYHQPPGMEIGCSVCLLRDAFQISVRKAYAHVREAEEKGKEPILTSTKEVVAEKVRAARAVLAEGKFCSHLGHSLVQFTSEPAP